jgi:hypothetical protein
VNMTQPSIPETSSQRYIWNSRVSSPLSAY